MSEEGDIVFDNKKMLEKITKLEKLSEDLISSQKDYNTNNELLSKNKDFINYLYEHQNVKDTQFYMLYPNMNLLNDTKIGIFHEIQRKNSVQFIQNIISNCIKNKTILDSKINEIKQKIIDEIKDPVELDILDKDISKVILPLASKKFPNFFKNSDEDEMELED